MPSIDHEMPLELFRNQPALAPELLQSVFGLRMPADTRVCLGSETFNAVDPTEFRGDATIIVGDPDKPDLAIVLECQLRRRRKDRKQYTWPVYLATLRARRECPAMLLVLCPDTKTAAMCAEPIQTGHPGWVLKPLVISPEHLPAVTDRATARQLPELALLSAPSHADGPDGKAVLDALCEAFETVSAASGGTKEIGYKYYDYVVSQLSAAARRSLEEIVSAGTYEFKTDFAREYYGRGKAEGKAEGELEAILAVLDARGLPVSEDARARITGCTDLAVLDTWIQRVATVESVEELFD